jgi:glucose/arabinose dehydrogenase
MGDHPRPMNRAIAVVIALLVAACSGPKPITPTPSSSSASGTPASGTPASGASVTPTGEPAPTPAVPSPSAPAASLPGASAPSSSSGSPPPTAVTSPLAPASFDPARVHVDLQPFAQGLQSPLFATGTADASGRLFVVEQAGRIRIVNGDGSVAPKPFLDITDRVESGGERGLLGLALHPGYPGNGRVFVDYTRQPDGATVISEFHASGTTADPASEQVLLTIKQPFANHNGGMVTFDPAGMLMIGMGDGGSGGDPQGNGQNRGVLLGKILRIDVDGAKPYGVPRDNPFPNLANVRPEIWDLGMRNPWRFSFDRTTGNLFIGDVGQGAWEEIDAEPAGQGGRDYGWNLMEGRHCFQSGCDSTGLIQPVAEYGHDSGCSVTGGYVYRGSRYPALTGGYLFSDYCSGTIWALSAAAAIADGKADPAIVGSAGFSVSSFGQGDDGELFAVDLSGRVLTVGAAAP